MDFIVYIYIGMLILDYNLSLKKCGSENSKFNYNVQKYHYTKVWLKMYYIKLTVKVGQKI